MGEGCKSYWREASGVGEEDNDCPILNRGLLILNGVKKKKVNSNIVLRGNR